jgi:hypothetical protein
MKTQKSFMMMALVLMLSGCVLPSAGPGVSMASGAPLAEAQWVRDGKPIEFEGELWFPTDDVERLLDSEVYQVGEYKSTLFFIDRVDVRPFERLYTRFSKNRYRAFEKKP